MSVMFTGKKAVKLKPGHTYEEFIIKRNECHASYDELMKALPNLTIYQIRDIYDKISSLPLEAIGTLR